jgi:hypothetical protein
VCQCDYASSDSVLVSVCAIVHVIASITDPEYNIKEQPNPRHTQIHFIQHTQHIYSTTQPYLCCPHTRVRHPLYSHSSHSDSHMTPSNGSFRSPGPPLVFGPYRAGPCTAQHLRPIALSLSSLRQKMLLAWRFVSLRMRGFSGQLGGSS